MEMRVEEDLLQRHDEEIFRLDEGFAEVILPEVVKRNSEADQQVNRGRRLFVLLGAVLAELGESQKV